MFSGTFKIKGTLIWVKKYVKWLLFFQSKIGTIAPDLLGTMTFFFQFWPYFSTYLSPNLAFPPIEKFVFLK